jgi:hypothetical protein
MTELVGQAELADKRRLADALKEIEQLHALQLSSLTTWLRHKDAKTGVAEQSLKQLRDARSDENRIMRNVLGIEPFRLAITRDK